MEDLHDLARIASADYTAGTWDQDHRRAVRDYAPTTEGETLGGPTSAEVLAAIDAFATEHAYRVRRTNGSRISLPSADLRAILLAWETDGRPHGG